MIVKIRESGMPEEFMWSRFFDPVYILKTIGLSSEIKNVADFGCGYGTFTIPAARIVSGRVYAIDRDPEMMTAVKDKILKNAMNNVETIERDILSEGSGLADESMEYVLLFNMLQTKYPVKLLKEAYRVLRNNGCVAIINWNLDPKTPRGPPMEMRPSLEKSVEWCVESGFDKNSKEVYDFKPYHYGLIMKKIREMPS